jgi:hypothetical protein
MINIPNTHHIIKPLTCARDFSSSENIILKRAKSENSTPTSTAARTANLSMSEYTKDLNPHTHNSATGQSILFFIGSLTLSNIVSNLHPALSNTT